MRLQFLISAGTLRCPAIKMKGQEGVAGRRRITAAKGHLFWNRLSPFIWAVSRKHK